MCKASTYEYNAFNHIEIPMLDHICMASYISESVMNNDEIEIPQVVFDGMKLAEVEFEKLKSRYHGKLYGDKKDSFWFRLWVLSMTHMVSLGTFHLEKLGEYEQHFVLEEWSTWKD